MRGRQVVLEQKSTRILLFYNFKREKRERKKKKRNIWEENEKYR
jgi:hypothetical protein